MSFRIAAALAAMILAIEAGAAGDPGDAATAGTIATVDQPRPFGYVVGDLVTQRVLLHSAHSDFEPDFEPAALPDAQRLNVWLERRSPRIESTADGRYWLVVDYQVINAPQSLTTVTLPAWEIASKTGETKLTIPAWPISVAALTPRSAFATGGLGELRPDRAAPVVATAPIRRQVIIWSIICVITLAAWLAWLQWRNWQDALNRPFARALHEIRRMDESTPQAWQTLHRAFDQTAGRVTQSETLPVLFQRAPHLQPLRPQIEQFFAQSAERFFGAGLAHSPVSVRALCSELRRIEKRHEQ